MRRGRRNSHATVAGIAVQRDRAKWHPHIRQKVASTADPPKYFPTFKNSCRERAFFLTHGNFTHYTATVETLKVKLDKLSAMF
jgi:hypothetical protein